MPATSPGAALGPRHELNLRVFELALELTVKEHLQGKRVVEVPTTWKDRTSGESRFKLLAWAPHSLRWYFKAFGRRRNGHQS